MKCLWKIVFGMLVAGMAIAVPAQTFNTVFYFGGNNGQAPLAVLAQGRDGNLYGTTKLGGNGYGYGTVFKITADGALTTLYSFCPRGNCSTGARPLAGLTLATDGNFYGTTSMKGGSGHNDGDVFRITSTGVLARVPFDGTDGMSPSAPVVQGVDGNLYGTTQIGGTGYGGVVFKARPPGVLTVLYNFCSQPNCADGREPKSGLVQASDGNFYGTTYGGGDGAYCSPQGTCGTVFKITLGGVLTTIYSFCSQSNCADGAFPTGPLVQGTDGNFYGTTSGGGMYGNGTVFRINPKGTLSALYSFCSQWPNCVDGLQPSAGVVQGTDGNLYGTTLGGGAGNGCCGTIFEMTLNGQLTTLHSFDGADGEYPQSGLFQATSGAFYGTTPTGGSTSCSGQACGTIFSLSMGLGPFVAFVQRAGTVGHTAEIIGQGFTGTTNVSFNGTSAGFTVQSDTYLTAKVPAGATTGYVTVTTSSGVLTSNVPFQVIP